MSSLPLQLLVLAVLSLAVSAGRPLVRVLRNDREFKKLIKHHKEVTGLPVIVDFYSDGCGPCRMIAPHFKRLAKEYKDRAVFAKVDVNVNRETSGSQMIRSMPTFQMYMNGKKKHQFSGGDVNQLQQWTMKLSREWDRNNEEITAETLKAFYAEHAPDAPEKAEAAAVETVLAKARKGGGKGFRSLAKALKTKYGTGPKLSKRWAPTTDEEEVKKKAERESAKQAAKGPNLHLASTEELAAALEERREAEAETRAEEEEAAEEEEEAAAPWAPHPEGYAETIVIVGGGPAGLSAAIYAARAGLKPIVIAPPVGGQLKGKGVQVDNYPAVDGLTGPSLVFAMEVQAAAAGAVFSWAEVVEADLSVHPFVLKTAPPAGMGGGPATGGSNGTETDDELTLVRTHALILATGANSRWLGVDGEEELRGGGVSSCATCDGFLYVGKPVVVVGGGDTAMEDALVLARTSSSVTVIHRRDAFRASHVLAQRVLTHPKITVVWNATVERFEGEMAAVPDAEGNPSGEELKVVKRAVVTVADASGAVSEASIPCDAAFVAIGHDPNTELFAEQLAMDANGYLVAAHGGGGSTKVSVEGVFGAGDVVDHVYRQAITSAGTGAMAALDAERWLSERGHKDEAEEAEAAFLRELMEDFEEEDEDVVAQEYVVYKEPKGEEPELEEPPEAPAAAAAADGVRSEL